MLLDFINSYSIIFLSLSKPCIFYISFIISCVMKDSCSDSWLFAISSALFYFFRLLIICWYFFYFPNNDFTYPTKKTLWSCKLWFSLSSEVYRLFWYYSWRAETIELDGLTSLMVFCLLLFLLEVEWGGMWFCDFVKVF